MSKFLSTSSIIALALALAVAFVGCGSSGSGDTSIEGYWKLKSHITTYIDEENI